MVLFKSTEQIYMKGKSITKVRKMSKVEGSATEQRMQKKNEKEHEVI